MFRNLVTVLRLIGRSKAPPSTAGLRLLLSASHPEALSSLGTGSAYAKREQGYAWDCLQKEVQALLSELLQQGESQGLREFQTGTLPLCLTLGAPHVFSIAAAHSHAFAHNQNDTGLVISKYPSQKLECPSSGAGGQIGLWLLVFVIFACIDGRSQNVQIPFCHKKKSF